MRIGAAITIVGAHAARNAASRLTRPVSAGSCRARIPAGGGGDTMNASDGQAGLAPPMVISSVSNGKRRFSLRASPVLAKGQHDNGRACRQLTPALLGVG